MRTKLTNKGCKNYCIVEAHTNPEINSKATTTIEREIVRNQEQSQFLKRVLIVDDEPNITFSFKVGLDSYYHENKRIFEVYTYNNPSVALSEFKTNFYDLLLTDINMPTINGFDLSQKILELDSNIRVCFMSAAEVNTEGLGEVYPKVNFGYFIKKPVEIEYLAKRLLAIFNSSRMDQYDR